MAYSKRIEVALRLQRPIDVVARAGQLAGIMGTELIDVLSAKEPIHRELANLFGDDQSGVQFVKHWGLVTTGSAHLRKTLRDTKELFVGEMAEVAEALRVAHPESGTNWDAPVVFFEAMPTIIRLRDTLRKAWDENTVALQAVQDVVKTQISSTLAFKKDEIEITAHNAWTLACLLFLLDHSKGKTVICGNPECPSRYFIAGRKNQQFCGDDACFGFAARERSSAWWNAHGNEWREQRRKEAHKKGRKH
jgi:hypothetical protein